MVLDHVAQGAGLFVVGAAVLDAERLGRRDLHVVDVAAVPDRFEDAVGETQHEDVLHGLLAQVVVDAVDLPLVEALANDGVERARAVEVAAERLFDHDPHPAPVVAVFAGHTRRAALVQPGFAEALDDHREQARRRGQVEDAVAAGVLGRVEAVEGVAQAPVAFGIVELALHVAHGAQHVVAGARLGRAGAEEAVDRVARQPAHVLPGQRLAAVADQREAERQDVVAGQVVQGRDELAAGEVAGDAEQHDGAGLGTVLDVEGRFDRTGARRLAQRGALFVVADGVHRQSAIWSSRHGRRTRCAARPGPCPRTSRSGASESARTAIRR